MKMLLLTDTLYPESTIPRMSFLSEFTTNARNRMANSHLCSMLASPAASSCDSVSDAEDEGRWLSSSRVQIVALNDAFKC